MSKLPVNRMPKPKTTDKLNLSRAISKGPVVEFVKNWGGYPVGARIRPSGILRSVLVEVDKVPVIVDDKKKKAAPRPQPQPLKKNTKKSEKPVPVKAKDTAATISLEPIEVHDETKTGSE